MESYDVVSVRTISEESDITIGEMLRHFLTARMAAWILILSKEWLNCICYKQVIWVTMVVEKGKLTI